MVPSLPGACQALLNCQHGVLARWQAADAGLDAAVIDVQLRRGRWQPLYRGVYAAFTGPPPQLAAIWAAILRGGPDAVLSHHSAAELDQLADRPGPVIHVTVGSERQVHVAASECGAGLPNVVVHRSARLGAARHPSRTPPRTRIEETALDLANTAVNLDDAWSWLARACSRRLTTPDRLSAALLSRARMRWRAELAAGLTDIRDGVLSALERRWVRRVERPHGLPAAKRQALSKVDRRTRYLDNHYEEFRVAVELDGQAAHPAEARWRDAHRDNASATAGILTLRYGWVDTATRPCQVASEVGRVLQTRGWMGHVQPCGPACPARPS